MNQEDKLIRVDRMRYTKDKLSSTLVLLSIVLDALYFISIYETDIGTYYYTWVIGASVVYNLLFLLIAFLCSEGVKNRQNGFMIPLLVLGALQIGRVFYLPAKAFRATVELAGQMQFVMETSQHVYTVACLAASGACCIAAAVFSTVDNKDLERYMRSLENESA